jgi:hypothetical protein
MTELDNILYKLIEFQHCHPNIYIGGSISLILQKAIPYRTPKDVDIISPDKTHIYDIFNIESENKHPLIRQYRYNNLKFELFINPKAEYIEYKYNNNILKISPIYEVFEWKHKRQNIYNGKHAVDINYYETTINQGS